MDIDTEQDPKVIADKRKHQSAIALMIDFLKKLANKWNEWSRFKY